MNALAFIHGLGSIGPFASRAFLPAFATAAILRWGEKLPWIGELGLLEKISGEPTWFTSDLCIGILGALALLELVATRSGEARQLLAEVDGWIKGGAAMLVQLGVISVSDQAFAASATEAAATDYLGLLPVGAATYFAAQARKSVVQTLDDADSDDSLGLAGLLGWAEDLWALGAAVLLLLFPLVMLAVTGIVLACIFGLQLLFRRLEKRSLQPCATCGVPTFACALACTNGHAVQAPHDVGFLGGCVDRPAGAAHACRLLKKRRCPRCATRLGRFRPGARCPACALALFAEPPTGEAFLGHLDRQLPLVLVVSLALSSVPVLGLVPGIVYYRFALVAPVAGYVPRGKRALTRVLLRVLLVFLLAVQWVPGAGALVVPLMALLSYAFYRRGFAAQLPARTR